nr:hypothetical protein [Tanacetum cinerariifolium]
MQDAEGLKAGVEHGKVCRELSAVAPYDPGVTTRYEEAVGELENILLPFLDRLKSYKYVPFERVMVSLNLEGFLNFEDETPDFCKLQTVLEQVLLGEVLEASLARAQRHRQGPLSSWVITKVATSGLDDSSLATIVTPLNTLSIVDYQISSLAVVDTTISTTDPHDDLFDATILDKPVDT